MEQQLQFEYKGQTSTLGSAAEICAWIEERKKRFPTKKRVEEKKAERERRVQEAQRIRTEALRAKNKSKQSERAGASVAEASGETKRIKGAAGADAAREKREKLRKKLKKQKRQLAKLDAELAKTDESKDAEPEASRRKRKHEEEINGVDEGKKQSGATQEDEEKIGEEDNPTPSLILSPPEMTSKPPEPEVETQAVEKMDESVSMSSGVSISSLTDSEDETSSSDASSSSPSSSSDDEAPDESSTRRTGPDKAAVRQGEKSGQICRRFLQTGRCSYSEKRGGCRFLHELPKHHSKGQGQRDSTIGDESGTARQAGKKGTRVKQQRKSLYQRMLENDREKEDTLVVRAIRHLAEHGLLDEPEPDAEGDVAVEGS
ncbi:MAG: hypothetical protein M1838_002493 [Thelocarpon superellum]|nr:MAG: hypothetical protein M1838_002493 [Thelocarpon superellum]